MMAARQSLQPGSRRDQRGVALLMVVAAIAILTAVAVDFSYHSRVEARLAMNARDELRAYYLASFGRAAQPLGAAFPARG